MAKIFMKGRKLPRSHGFIIHDFGKRGLPAQQPLLYIPLLLLYLNMAIFKDDLIVMQWSLSVNSKSVSKLGTNG